MQWLQIMIVSMRSGSLKRSATVELEAFENYNIRILKIRNCKNMLIFTLSAIAVWSNNVIIIGDTID